MNRVDGCYYCVGDQRLQEWMIKIADLRVSTLHLFKEQTYRGRCLLSFKGHKSELFHLNSEELTLYMLDLVQAARAIQKACNPAKLNYGAFSDKLAHLRFHIVPKYKEGYSWGSTFEMMPGNMIWLSDGEYERLVKSIKEKL